MKHFITFGFDHRHVIGDRVFDKDCVCLIDSGSNDPGVGRQIAFDTFGREWSMEYPEKYFDFTSLDRCFKRGIIKL